MAKTRVNKAWVKSQERKDLYKKAAESIYGKKVDLAEVHKEQGRRLKERKKNRIPNPKMDPTGGGSGW